MRGEVYCGYGEKDRFGAPDMLAALAAGFAGNAGVAYRFNLHAGVKHGYGLPDRDVYAHDAVETDWREIFAMFDRQLKMSARAGSRA